jgi:hypothetical protein
VELVDEPVLADCPVLVVLVVVCVLPLLLRTIKSGGMGGKSSPATWGGIGGINDASTGVTFDPVPEVEAEAEDIAPEVETPPPAADDVVCGNVATCEAPDKLGCCWGLEAVIGC